MREATDEPTVVAKNTKLCGLSKSSSYGKRERAGESKRTRHICDVRLRVLPGNSPLRLQLPTRRLAIEEVHFVGVQITMTLPVLSMATKTLSRVTVTEHVPATPTS